LDSIYSLSHQLEINKLNALWPAFIFYAIQFYRQSSYDIRQSASLLRPGIDDLNVIIILADWQAGIKAARRVSSKTAIHRRCIKPIYKQN
jgi:hypothetical protein